ncbi:hypothetical protein CRM22_002485 [Opisthorchis felineus]|uniref:Uncharacterized protein n=1 Tax=Opisthorchis felineus TaxID=147828 RepID=A0A4V3SGC7_OPIFE|nr:hypothetical protein CRM22_002485 [Opisthorchis felineus]TGZ71794.1 hypothetical protein CRM22_002485 [Opisthorchis felineus]
MSCTISLAECDNRNMTSGHSRWTKDPNISVVQTALERNSSESGESAEDSSVDDDETSKPRILWKAFIQNPVRLSEDDAWPIARPEHFGLMAPERRIIRDMDKTVSEYETILPALSSFPDRRFRAASVVSRSTLGGRTAFSSSVRNRRQARFLKTIPTGTLHFPPLIRSQHFEQFLMFSTGMPHRVSFDAEGIENTDALILDHRATTDESIQFPMEKHPKVFIRDGSNSALEDSPKTSIYRSIFGQSISKIRRDFPIQPEGPIVHRALAALKSLHLLRMQSGETSMPDNVLLNLQAAQKEEFNTKKYHRHGHPTTTSLKHLRSRNKCPHFPEFLVPSVIDLDDMYRGPDILEAKIKDHDLQLPIHPETAKDLRQLYTITILKDSVLKDLLKSSRIDALPKSLRHLVRMGALHKHTGTPEKGTGELEAIARQTQYCPVRQAEADTAIGDLENLWIEAKIFTTSLFNNWIVQMQPNMSFGKYSQTEMDMRLRCVTKTIRAHSSVATSKSRTELCILLATCASFPQYIPVLMNRISDWLEVLLNCLFSRERTVREEACYILAYLFTERNLVDAIRYHPMIDIGYDVAVTVLQAIEVSSSSFLHFFCLLALMIEGCPMYSILHAVMDVSPSSPNTLLNHLWPRLLYYALKYWHKNMFSRDRLLLKSINESIERAYVRGISRKQAKLAQIQLSRRFRLVTKPTTIWLDEWKNFNVK